MLRPRVRSVDKSTTRMFPSFIADSRNRRLPRHSPGAPPRAWQGSGLFLYQPSVIGVIGQTSREPTN
jgi:hypothetical protein